MTSTRESTHEDRWPSPGESYLPYETEISNMDSSGSLQTGLCGNVTCRSKGSCEKEQEKHDSEQPGSLRNSNIRAVKGQSNVCPEISKESIRIEQEKDLDIKLILQWKRATVKPAWPTLAPHGKEVKVYWHKWDMIEIKDEILCKKHFRNDGTGADFLYTVPVSLRKGVFQHLHTYITSGHLGRR